MSGSAFTVTSVFVRRAAASVRRAADIHCRGALFDIGNLSFLIDHERSAIRNAPLGHQYAVRFGGFAGREIAEERKGEGKFLGKFGLGWSVIGADSEDLRFSAFKLGDTSLVSRHFLRSTTRERSGEEGDDHVFLAAEVGELDFLALGR